MIAVGMPIKIPNNVKLPIYLAAEAEDLLLQSRRAVPIRAEQLFSML